MARLRKPKKKSKLDKIRHEKAEVSRLIRLTELGGNRTKYEKFLARWHTLCSQELRAMVEASNARKPAAA